MRNRPPVTRTMEITDAEHQVHDLIDRVSRDGIRILVERQGTPVAGIVSAADLRRLDRLDAESAERFRVLDEFAAAFADVPEDELERETAQALAEVRAERRAERYSANVATR